MLPKIRSPRCFRSTPQHYRWLPTCLGEAWELRWSAGVQAIQPRGPRQGRQAELPGGAGGGRPGFQAPQGILRQGQGVQGAQVVLQGQAVHGGRQAELAQVGGVQQGPAGLRGGLEPHSHGLLPCMCSIHVKGLTRKQ